MMFTEADHGSFTLTIGHLSTVYHTSFILMGTDWLENAGINAEWKLFASGPDIVKAFANNEIDLAYIGLPPAMIGIDRGLPVICVAGGHMEGTVMIAGAGYGTLDELKNKRTVLAQFEGKLIGSPPKGSIHDVIIRHFIEEAGLVMEVKNFPWTDFVLEALVDGEIEGAVGTPSLAVAASHACGSKIIFPPHALWRSNPSYGIVVRKELLDSPFVITGFLRQHEKACNFIRNKPADAARIVSQLTGIVDEDFVIEAYGISPKYCASLSGDFVRSAMAFLPVLKKLGYIAGELFESEIFLHGFIDKIHKEPPHY